MSDQVNQPVQTPGVLARVGAAVRLVVTGKVNNTTFFGPLEPLAPVAQDEAVGRRFDYRPGYNISTQPRGSYDDRVSFGQLRALADNLDVLRLVIETRKDQVAKLEWTVQPKDKSIKAAADPRCQAIADFLHKPDRENSWDSWLRMLVEDMLVIDAATIYPRMTRGGDLYSLDLIDGATIKPILDGYGRRPEPPLPAYQQVLVGLPAVDYAAGQLLYLPRNRRTHKVYGYSPVEQIVVSVNMGLRRQMQQLQFYTEGTVPEALVGVPDSWSPDQIDQFQSYFDALLTDNMAQRRKVRFMPGDLAKNFVQTKEAVLKDEFDEWLARIISYAFNVSPQWAVKQMNRATAGTAQEMALEEGLTPLKAWIKSIMDTVIQTVWGFGDLEFCWQDEEEIDPSAQDTILSGQLKLGVINRNEYRAELGREPIDNGDVYLVYTATGAMTVDAILNPPAPPPQLDDNSNGDEGPLNAGSTPDQPVVDDKKKATGADMTKAAGAPAFRRLGPPDTNRPAAVKARKALEILFRDLFRQEAKAVALKSRTARRPMLKADISEDGDGDGVAPLDAGAWDTAQGNVAGVLKELAQDGVSTGAASVAVSADTPEHIVDLANPRAVDWAENHAGSLIKDLQGTTLDALRSIIAKGEAEGWSVDRIAKAIEADSTFGADRAKLIASMETRTADYQANLIAWKSAKEMGIAVMKAWITRGDNICAECEANEADGPIPVDQAFSGGDDAPPAHVNCECDVEPVLAEGESGNADSGGDDADTSEEE